MSVDQQRSEKRDSGENSTAQEDRLLFNPWVVLGLLFFVTLFLGLPLLWMSPRFSLLGKLAITLLNLAYSAAVLWAFYLLMVWCYGRIADSLR